MLPVRLVVRAVGVLLGLFALFWLFTEWFGLQFGIDPPGKSTSWVLLAALVPILVGSVAVGLARAWGAALIAAVLAAVWVWEVAVAWDYYAGGAGFTDDLVVFSPPLLIPAVAAVLVAIVLSRTRPERGPMA